MTKYFCDICGNEITDFDTTSEFKLKKLEYSWHEHWWSKLIVHNDCWTDLCELIKQRRTGKLMMSVTVQGGDVEQVPFDEIEFDDHDVSGLLEE